MKRLIECVPNFSEGRDLSTVDLLVDAMSHVPGAWVLDRTSDADHNRSVITVAGEPDAVAEAAIRGAGAAADLIDMTRHTGVHPRIGATDVIPFVPLEGVSIDECVALARRVSQELWDRYSIPVYFYEAAATRPERVNLENIRRGQFEALREAALRDPDRSPDIGEPRLHPTAGATAVGVRKLLIACNILLNTGDVGVAKKIARAVRYSSGGLRYVKAIGAELESRGLAQVSINLTDFEQTPLHRLLEMVKREAERHGCSIAGTEIVGLIPRKALELAAEYYLQLQGFSPTRVLENRLASVIGVSPAKPAQEAAPGAMLQQLLESLRVGVLNLSAHAASAAHKLPPGHETDPDAAAESYLTAAGAAAQIYAQLVQLETVTGSSMHLDMIVVRQMAMAAAQAAIESAGAVLPQLQDASSVTRIKTQIAQIEAQLSVRPSADRVK